MPEQIFGCWRLSSNPRDLPHAVRRFSMLPYRAVRAYFASCFVIALFVCGFKHAILMTRLGLEPLTVDVELSPQPTADGRQSVASAVREMPNVASLSPSSFADASVPLRPDAEAKRTRHTEGAGLSTAGNETTRRRRIHIAETARNSATVGAKGNDRATSPDAASQCRPETLGLPPRVAELCDGNASDAVDARRRPSSSGKPPACVVLTCYNMANEPTIADKLNGIAADFEASHPVRIPADADLAALSSGCDVWRTKYGFDDMPPVSPDEESFPLAFNILAHQHAHQVDTSRGCAIVGAAMDIGR